MNLTGLHDGGETSELPPGAAGALGAATHMGARGSKPAWANHRSLQLHRHMAAPQLSDPIWAHGRALPLPAAAEPSTARHRTNFLLLFYSIAPPRQTSAFSAMAFPMAQAHQQGHHSLDLHDGACTSYSTVCEGRWIWLRSDAITDFQ
jgi:hypothetical protein